MTSSWPAGRVRRFDVRRRDPVAKTWTESAGLSVDAIADSLRTQGIPFRGPFCWRAKLIFFVVGNYILLESELFELLGQGNLHQEGIQHLTQRIEAENSRH